MIGRNQTNAEFQNIAIVENLLIAVASAAIIEGGICNELWDRNQPGTGLRFPMFQPKPIFL